MVYNLLDYGKISGRIIQLRDKAGLSQEEFGMAIGVSQQTVCMWESGRKLISLENAIALCEEFDCDLDYLYFGKDSNGYLSHEKEIAGNVTGLPPAALDNYIHFKDNTLNNTEITNRVQTMHAFSFLKHLLQDHIEIFAEMLYRISNIKDLYENNKEKSQMDIEKEAIAMINEKLNVPPYTEMDADAYSDAYNNIYCDYYPMFFAQLEELQQNAKLQYDSELFQFTRYICDLIEKISDIDSQNKSDTEIALNDSVT